MPCASFLLSIPAVLGANILSLKDVLTGGVDWSQLPVYLAGVVVVAVSGYLCIRLLKMIADGTLRCLRLLLLGAVWLPSF
ncbi:MAG: hypothetical protein ACLUIX_01745 [Oscillospiraceae bacterium]